MKLYKDFLQYNVLPASSCSATIMHIKIISLLCTVCFLQCLCILKDLCRKLTAVVMVLCKVLDAFRSLICSFQCMYVAIV